MERNVFLQEYLRIIYYSYQLKNALNILVALLELNYGNLRECRKKIFKKEQSQTAILLQLC